MGCHRAEQLLRELGFEVTALSVQDRANFEAMEKLGFDSVPTILIGDKAFAGFPDEVIYRELGLESLRPMDFDGLVAELDTAAWCLAIFSERVVPRIPDDLWYWRLVPERDRPLGQWVYHVFRFANEVINTLDRGFLTWGHLKPGRELEFFEERDSFSTFSAIAVFGREVKSRFSAMMGTLTPEVAFQEVGTPWGELPVSALFRHVSRHTATHMAQTVGFLREKLGQEVLDSETLARIPSFTSLRPD